MTFISTKDSAHYFIVKFSPSVGVAVVASLTREIWLHKVLLILLIEHQILLLSMVCVP